MCVLVKNKTTSNISIQIGCVRSEYIHIYQKNKQYNDQYFLFKKKNVHILVLTYSYEKIFN